MCELRTDKELIERGNDQNSSSGSEDCPSDDNFSNVVLSQLLPVSTRKKKRITPNTQLKDQLNVIFGLGRTKKAADKSDPKLLKTKPKEDKKKEAAKLSEKKAEKPIPKPEPPLEEAKKDSLSQPSVVMVDAWTQTDKIDFARARSKMIMNKFGKSRYRKNFCNF